MSEQQSQQQPGEGRFQEAKETFGKMLRWTEQARNAEQAEQTVFIGTTLQGIFTSKREKVGRNASNVYEVKTETGEVYSVWGSSLLDGKFAKVPMGSEIRLTYLGVSQPKTPQGRAYANFRLEFAKPLTQMVEASQANAAAPAGENTQVDANVDEGY